MGNEIYENAAEDIIPVFEKLRDKHALEWLNDFRIAYLFKLKRPKSGKIKMGVVKTTSAEMKFFTGIDVIFIIDKKAWFDIPEYHEPLLFHLINHLDISQNDQLVKRDYDVKEFTNVIRVYGEWHPGLEIMKKQLDIFKQEEISELRDEGLRLLDQMDIKYTRIASNDYEN